MPMTKPPNNAPSPTAALKSDARHRALERRDALPAKMRAVKSARICEELSALSDALRATDRAECETSAPSGLAIAVFSSMKSEVDLRLFIQHAYAAGDRVAFPAMVRNPAWRAPSERTTERSKHPAAANTPYVPRLLMKFFLVPFEQYAHGEAPFVTHPLRIFEGDDPELGVFESVAPETVDLAVCPLVAFDAQRNRLGYGGGNYDAFLSRLDRKALALGVAFQEQELPIGAIPLEPHDLPLPRIVTA